MKSRLYVSLFGLIGLALGMVSTQAGARDLSGVTVEWAPHYGSAMPDGGALTVITKAAFERVGHDADVEFIAWNRALKNVEEGKDDFILGAYYNDERAQKYLYSDVIYHVDFGLVALDTLGVSQIDGLESVKDYTIGITLGFANTEEFDQADYLIKEVAPTPTLNIRKLYRERIDMVVGAFDIIRFEAQNEDKNPDRLVFIQPPLQRIPIYNMMSRNIPDGEQILADFNRGLQEIKNDGTMERILQEYLGRSG